MNAAETGELLAFAALYDNRKVGDPDVVAWLKAIGDLPYADAEAAVAAHYGESTERIMPGHVRTRVKAMRRDRLAREIVPAPSAEPGRYRAELRAGIRQIADGKAVHLAIGGPVREDPPPQEFTEARTALGPALPRNLQELARLQAAESRAEREAREAAAPPEELGGAGVNGAYRILVTGSRDWDDAQELRLALIRTAVPHLPSIVVIHGACPSGADAMTAQWASDYGVRTEGHPADMDAAGAHVCLAFIRGGSPEASRCADAAERARIPVRRYLQAA